MKRLFLLALIGVLLAVPGSSTAATTSTVTIADNIWSWWVHPIVSHADGATYVGGISSGGTVRVHRIIDGGVDTAIVDAHQADEHNPPAVLARDGHVTIVAWAEHEIAEEISVTREIAPGSNRYREPMVLHVPHGNATYAQLAEAGGRVWLATRAGGDRWVVTWSDDDGASWADWTLILDAHGHGRSYLLMRPAGDVLHVAMYGHPTSSDWHDVEYAAIDGSTGAVTLKDRSGNVLTGEGLPIRPGDAEPILEPVGPWRVRLLDLGTLDGAPAIAYAVWHTDHHDARYRIARQNDSGAWTRYELSPAGVVFGYEPEVHYHGGVALGGDTIVTSSEHGGRWLVERWAWDDGPTWDGLLSIAVAPVVRPYLAGDTVAWHRIHRYDGYRRYLADTVVAPLR